eukprot:TRINITY_DN10836_c0_g1_i3.p1 TRINITY_DN10836_c0_g1~~TRINITY_DN10836_c0_g1_i3.p1  ORF type:complete len:295 (-),score=80.78 TRINITY_DN10836_c0_g1_i3:30-914(-)
MDYYVILGVEKDATEEQIKKAYKRKALQFHPDKNKDADAEEKFKEIAEAYEVLSDVNKKSIFDKYGEKGLNQKGGSHANGFSRNTSFHPSDPFDLFKSFFGDHDPLSDIFASVFNQHVNPFSNGSHQFSKLNNISLTKNSVKDDPSATTTYEERNGDGGTVHITKTIIGGDGKVRREMRFRTQSASRADEEERRRDESKTVLGRQQSAPTGHVSTSVPIKLNKPTERKEKENIEKEKEKEISTATITIKAPKPKPCPTIISNIKINHVKTPEMKRREDNVVNLPETKITIKLKT